MARPVVGISGNAYFLDDQYPVQACGVYNLDAVSEVCDATVIVVPCLPHLNPIEDLMDVCDGFVFTGARPNVHPEEYGEQPTEAHGVFDRDRDAVTLPLIRACVDRGQPVLGICRGFQEFNVAFGGTLHPEIRELPGRMNHRMPPDGTLEEKFALRHEVSINKGSPFARIFAAERVLTNTLHGQGIKAAANRVVIDGRADDGTPEAISIKGAPGFALAVQWHPEYNASKDPVSRALFGAFGVACAVWRTGKGMQRTS
ncbi:MAG: gamma-glutamyl-gamma-aminobutyrate hydrolase family protein [Rhodobacteraceae bacterium]|nr:gamma-glutamyl-gamma-aminobutyrate hydrolase family protein [Paracoccaceae bacterium]